MHEPLPLRYAAAAGEVLPARHVLHRDYETRSKTVLKLVGTHRYAADPSSEILCVAYAVDDEPVQLWLPCDPVPPEFVEAANNPSWLVAAHGDHFETAIEQHILAPRHGWPLVPLVRHHCTMAMALALGLPARLDKIANALELTNRKDAAGERLMHQMSKPRRPHKDEPAGIYWFDDPERIDRLCGYCRQDVEVEREIYGRLPPLSPTEHTIWVLSSTINGRGFCVDRAFAEAARRIAQAAAPEIDQELAELTGRAVTGINQIARLLAWLEQQGCTLRKLDKAAIERQLERVEELPAPMQRVLELRLGGAQAAVKKIDALLARAGTDDRVRGAFRYHGASTGRWSGEGFQPQNLKRPVAEDLVAATAAVATGDYAHVQKLYSRPLAVVGDCSRSMIIAAPGRVLIGADFGAIESRVLAWVAGEVWKLDAYRRYDATHDPCDEPYCILACKMLHVPEGSITPDRSERAYGKTGDLACGYMGGANAIEKFAPGVFSERERIKTEWRTAHPAIKRFWYAIDRAAWTAMRDRSRVVCYGPVAFKSNGTFLQLKLPSGRKLSYPQPRIIGDEREQHVLFSDNGLGQFKDCRFGQGAYGGLWTENIVSGIARDLLAEAMLRIEAAGYPIVLHVHDEVVAEVPEGFGSFEEFTRLMTCKPVWALNLPIAAKAWTGPRYCKSRSCTVPYRLTTEPTNATENIGGTYGAGVELRSKSVLQGRRSRDREEAPHQIRDRGTSRGAEGAEVGGLVYQRRTRPRAQ
jgi:DNA polymerase bacteriophage-type